MTQDQKKAMIKMLLEAYKETGNRRFLLRALKLTEIECNDIKANKRGR